MNQTYDPLNIKGTVDFALITIREDEFEAVLKFFPPTGVVTKERTYSICDFKGQNQHAYRAALLRCFEQGHSSAQSATSDVIHDLDPKWIVLVGIAGAVPEYEFSLGDVVVATRMFDFSLSAALSDGRQEVALRAEPSQKIIQDLISHLPALKQKLGDWNSCETLGMGIPEVEINEQSIVVKDGGYRKKLQDSLEHRFKNSENKDRRPLVAACPIASGNMLVKDSEVINNWMDQARDLKAIEMELPGVFEAARRRVGSKPVLAIRGISDVVGFKRDPKWTSFACTTAASLARSLLETLDPRTMSGRLRNEGLLKTEAKESTAAIRTVEAEDEIPVHFSNHFEVEPVSIAHLLNEIKCHPENVENIKIHWPKELKEIEEYIHECMSRAVETPRHACLAQVNKEDLADWVSNAKRAVDILSEQKRFIEKRFPFFIKSFVDRLHEPLVVKYLRKSIHWFFARSIISSYESAIFLTSFEPFRNEPLLEPWNKIIVHGGLASEKLQALYKENDEVLYARIEKVGNYYTDPDGSGYEYFFGPNRATRDCSGKTHAFYPSLIWYYEWIIPQLEIMLAFEESQIEVDYDKSILPTGVVKRGVEGIEV